MEVLTILEWLLAWGMLLFAQSVFINGVYQSATGETKKRVDGSDEDSEMILYPLKKLFEKTKLINVQYKAEAFLSLIKLLQEKYPGLGIKPFIWNAFGVTNATEEVYTEWNPIIEKQFGIIIKGNPAGYFIYKEHSAYKYSKWLRKPIIQCIKCMSSFWGALTFWPVVLFIFGFHLLEVPIFFADVFSLTYLNWILYKKAQ